MRTKALILSALVCAGGLSSALAQTTNVYSVNAVGYINLSLPSGFSMIANQLNTTNNTIGSLLTNLPNFSNFYKWNGNGFDIATFAFGSWDHPTYSLAPGEGGFVGIGSAASVTLVGEVPQGNLTNSIPAGYSIQSSQVPQAGALDTLGLTLNNFDNVYKWNGSNYTIFTYAFGSWSPSVPQVAVGESFFVAAGTSTTWTRSFSVNQ